MSGILIPCPECGSGLRLKDRSKLGKLGRCPKCGNRFVLQEPEEVELELADASVPSTGTAAQWIPDSEASDAQPAPARRAGRSQPARVEEGVGGFPIITDPEPGAGIQITTHPTIAEGMSLDEVVKLLGKPAKRKQMSELAAQAKKQGKKFDAPADASKREYLVFQHAAGAYKLIFLDGKVVEIHSQPAAGAGTAKAPLVPSQSRRSQKQKMAGIALGGVLGLVLVVVLIVATQIDRQPEVVKAAPKKQPPQVDQKLVADKSELEQNAEFAKKFAEENLGVKNEMLTFERIPAGARIIIHLRPAELWSDQPQFAYFRASLTADVTKWMESAIKSTCLVEPKDIEDALICIIPGGRGEPPQFATRVKLTAPRKKSEFLTLFGGQRTDDYGDPVYIDSERAYLVEDDLQTFAVSPASLADEMARARGEIPTGTSDGIQSILLNTDKTRHATVVFEPLDVRIHQEFLVGENVRPVLKEFLDWLGGDVETAAWSMHLGSDRFYSQFLFRNGHDWTPLKLEREVAGKLDRLPQDLYAAVQMMRPKQVGSRKIIGRFPAMMKVYSLSTMAAIGDRLAQFTTVLPAKAAPNLALGTLLAWDESTRTDFTQKPPEPKSNEPKLPDLIVDRLKFDMDVDFRRRPLQDAFSDIGEATHVAFEIDGDALKAAGYTKNMAQTFNLGEVPATQAIKKILSQYDKMCVCITDEDKNIVTVMTFEAAKQKKLTPLKF